MLGRYENAKFKGNQRREQGGGKGFKWSDQAADMTEGCGIPLLWGVCAGVNGECSDQDGDLANGRDHGCFDVCPN